MLNQIRNKIIKEHPHLILVIGEVEDNIEILKIYDEMLTSSFNPFFFKHLLVLVQQVALGLNHNVILGNC
jgi:hypothetical protein